jgi:hypothetical protein
MVACRGRWFGGPFFKKKQMKQKKIKDMGPYLAQDKTDKNLWPETVAIIVDNCRDRDTGKLKVKMQNVNKEGFWEGESTVAVFIKAGIRNRDAMNIAAE